MSTPAYKATRYPGVYVRQGKRGPIYRIRYRGANGRRTGRIVHGTLEDAVRAREAIRLALWPDGPRGVATPVYLDPLEEEALIAEHSAGSCIYVGQRKINPVIVKIGLSTFRGIHKRAEAERLHLLLVIPGDRAREAELHARFTDFVCDVDGREFFFLTRKLRAWIEEEREAVRESVLAGSDGRIQHNGFGLRVH